METENRNGRNEQNKPHVTLLAKWLTAFSEIYGRDVTKEKIKLYAGLLADVPIDALDVALRLAAQSCKNFPTIADIRLLIRQQVQASEQLEAEKSWNLVKRIFQHHWHPDIGMHSQPPVLDPAGEYALRQIGGFRRFSESLVEHEGFLRRDFLEAYKRFCETGGLQFPTREQAGQLLDSLRKELAQ